jgi:hypothetical protein
MTGLGLAALLVATAWLAVLTVVVLVLVRQIGLLTVRLDFAGTDRVWRDSEGPELGSTLPEEVTSRVAGLDRGLAYLILLEAGCGPCRILADDLRQSEVIQHRVVAVLRGAGEVADGMAELLPPWVEVVRDPAAGDIVDRLEIEVTPSAVEVEDGTVTGKALVRGTPDLLELIEAREAEEADAVAALPADQVTIEVMQRGGNS